MLGLAVAISPSMRITSTTSVPASAYEMMTAGPAFSIAFADPTNNPAPMTPAIEIIVMCLGLRLVPNVADVADPPVFFSVVLTTGRPCRRFGAAG